MPVSDADNLSLEMFVGRPLVHPDWNFPREASSATRLTAPPVLAPCLTEMSSGPT